ncbi:oligopeptide transporter 4 [Actinidia rufa]|uniref:Oligopeptide transporter 4 n=1 Tax=Actinidia rufa TaxID=165716 RepID=A0A7J0FY33_9ERIC|nr:oligopeptide transporter 4 [Actinidia rufa]
MSRARFFLIALFCSFSWYLVPGYLFTTLSNISWVCWAFSKSVTAQQIGSGMTGLGLGALTLDWTIVCILVQPPHMALLFHCQRLPWVYLDHVHYQGQRYNMSAIVNKKFEIDMVQYEKQGRINLSMFFALSYGFGFAAIASTLTHVALFYGREIYERFRASYKGKEDIHTRLMRNYKDIPSWWFHPLLGVTIAVSLVLCIFLNDQVQMPWWGLLFASVIAFIFTLPISVITATTNMSVPKIFPDIDIIYVSRPSNAPRFYAQTEWLVVITEYIMGIIYPGRPIANICFKTYGHMSTAQAVSFLSDFKLGHYMKIPPRSMFLVQLIGTIIAGTVNILVAWWQLTSIENICQDDLLPHDSPWKCPRVAFMAVLLYFSVGIENKQLNWWGTHDEHCDLATCPTAKGIVVDGCPVKQ